MLDIKLIRENPSILDEALKKRGAEPLSAKIRELDELRRARITEIQTLQQARNNFAKEIGAAKKAGQDASELLKKAEENNKRLKELEEKNEKGDELDELLSTLPNIPADDVPLGKSEADNKEIRKWGEPKKFDFTPLEHFDIGEKLGLMSFEDGAKLSGARFVVLKGLLARLERALAQFMLDTHTSEFGYTEVSPPLLVKDSSVYGTGQLPKFGEDLFRTTNGFWLIPTAEVSLTNLVNGEILDEAKLPYRFTAHTPCFRSEAGAAGKDTRGMIRQHQFGKVELVSITTPEQSNDEHERMTKAAETILQRLGLPYRTIVLCTGDMGFSARKTYDIEVWLPGQNQYREISSCSNCGDFQGRRMKSRFRKAGEKEIRIVHTLNGSGLAVGRALIAVLENYQNQDGSVTIPEALRPYMGGVEKIS